MLDEDQDEDAYGWFPCNFTEWIEEEEEEAFEVEEEFLHDEEEGEKEEEEDAVYYATVIADYVPEDGASSYLSLSAGDVVCVMKSDESGWCFGYVYNEENEDIMSQRTTWVGFLKRTWIGVVKTTRNTMKRTSTTKQKINIIIFIYLIFILPLWNHSTEREHFRASDLSKYHPHPHHRLLPSHCPHPHRPQHHRLV